MAKEEAIIMEGKVIESLPNAMFRVEVKTGEGDEQITHNILGYLSGRLRQHNINIAIGDSVKMELSPYDLSKGRITYRN